MVHTQTEVGRQSGMNAGMLSDCVKTWGCDYDPESLAELETEMRELRSEMISWEETAEG